MRKKIAVILTLVFALCLAFATGCFSDDGNSGNSGNSVTSETGVTSVTVRFDSDGGTEIPSVKIERGEKITKPENPTKEHYVFGGWFVQDKEWAFESDTVTEDVTLKAKWTPEVYSVTFKNYDGTELTRENVSYGTAPKYTATPEKAGDKQYSYKFVGWEDENGKIVNLEKIDRNIVLTAKFTSVTNKYKVIFKNGDEVLKEYDEEYGKMPVAPEETPTKPADVQYTYTFKGWDKQLAEVTDEAVYIAEFDKTLNKYKVTFKNGDEVLKEEVLDYGTTPTAPEETPTKPADAQYTYTFKGWDKDIAEVTGEVVYNAEFNETLNKYKVTFKNGDEVLKEEVLDYGTTPAAPEETPTKPADAQYTYTFKGWDKDIAEVIGEVVYNAEFDKTLNKYKVTFKNGDEVLKEEVLDYGTMPTAPDAVPVKAYDAENHYTFKDWDKEISAVAGEKVYSAQFNAVAHVYVVNSSDETTDYIVCSCGYKDETYAYDKTITSARKSLPVEGTELSLTVEGATYVSVEKMTVNGAEISGTIDSFAFPSEVKADKERHGEQTIVLTVKDERGFAHELNVSVLLITKEIATLDDLNAALKTDGDDCAIYGYYKLVASLGSANYNGIQNASSGNGNNNIWPNADGLYGFRGTFDGNNQSISAIIYSNGIFGIIGKGAYVKDLTVNAYGYANGRTTLARTITGATLENVTINVKSGSSNSYYAEGGVITALLSHSSRYVNVKVNSSSDLDTLFGFSYWNYNPAKANTFENCAVEAKSIGGVICITTTDKMTNPIVSVVGLEGLSVTLLRDAVAADNMTVGQAKEIELSDVAEITSITLENEEFSSYSFENGVLTINADAFTAYQIGVKTFTVKGKNADGLNVVFDITMTVELVAAPVTVEKTSEIVLSEASEYAVDLGDYADATVINATFAGENATFADGKLTITDAFKADVKKHGEQALVVTVEKDNAYYNVTVNVLVITKAITSFDELKSALTLDANNVKFGYYRLQNELTSYNWYQSGNNVGGGIWKNPTGELGFRGTFDGNGLSIRETLHTTGLFGYIGKGAVIKNLTINLNQYKYSSGTPFMVFGYSMIGATVDNVKVNVTKQSGDGITAVPDGISGLLTSIFAYGNTFNKLTIVAQNTEIDTLFGSCKYYGYPAAYEENKFTECTVKAKSLLGLACVDNANKTVIPYNEVSGLTVTTTA